MDKNKTLPSWLVNKHNKVIQRFRTACETVDYLRNELVDYQNYLIEKELDNDFRIWLKKQVDYITPKSNT